MHEFIFLFRGGTMPEAPEHRQAIMQKWSEWIRELIAQEKYISGERLEGSGKTISGVKKIVTDGPFIESKEMVGDYVIVKANNLEEAVEISKECPIFQMEGRLETRQIQKTGL